MRNAVLFAIMLLAAVGQSADIAAAASAGKQKQPAAKSGNTPAEQKRRGPADESSPPASSIPKDARWTIICMTFAGNDHYQQAKAVLSQVQKATQLRDWYIVQSEGQSTLYHGFYCEIDERVDAREAARAQSDRRVIAGLMNPATGYRMFRAVLLVALDAADPTAPAEWNLANTKGYYSLQVGVYKDHPQRKEAAVQAVREARAAGYEAYYYHGPSASSVCIGVWPESAIRKEIDATAKNPRSVIMVTPGSTPVPQGMTTSDGRPVDVVQPKVEILDASLAATMRMFPVHAVNGVEAVEVLDTRTNTRRLERHPSVLVAVPRSAVAAADRTVTPSGSAAAGQSTDANDQAVAAPATPWRVVRPKSGATGGKLRSLEDK